MISQLGRSPPQRARYKALADMHFLLDRPLA